MRAVFLVPRREDHGHRDMLWAWCKARWEALMPDVPVYEGHHTTGPFNRAAAINIAAAEADLDGHWDVAVVIDADVFLSVPNVRKAIASAVKGKVTWAHRRWRNISPSDTNRLIKDPDTFGEVPADARDMDLLVDKTTPISWSCCVAIPRSTFDDMGGFDERFVGWGFEDGAWAALVRGLYGWDRIEGDIYHWHHPRSDERIVEGESALTARPEYIRNALLGRRYMIAAIRDHAAGDQKGEEHLSPEMVKVHVRNLTTDDARFLKLADRLHMPEAREWRNWWPTLEDLREGVRAQAPAADTVTLILRTGGEPETWEERSGYLRRSIASLAEQISGPIVQRVIYSDWGPEHRQELEAIGAPYGFYIAGPDRHVGYVAAAQALWRYIDKRAAGTWIFAAEDDFLYRKPVDLTALISAHKKQRSLRQIALLRNACYPRELESDGILGWPEASFERVGVNGTSYMIHRNFWTMNPSLFHRSVTTTPWPRSQGNVGSERVFGDLLLRDQHARFALWGEGEPFIEHIGEVRAASAY